MTAALAVSAASLTFELRDGSTFQVGTDDLAMSFVQSNLVASWNGGSKEIPVSQLSSFYFQAVPTSLVDFADATDLSVEIFSIDGRSLGRFDSLDIARNSLAGGLYVVKSQSETFKTVIR